MSQYQIGVHIVYAGNESYSGHMFITLHEPGGRDPAYYGFYPRTPYSINDVGKVTSTDSRDHNITRPPGVDGGPNVSAYFPISESQFKEVSKWAADATTQGHDFNGGPWSRYNGIYNSCIDFAWTAVRKAGIDPALIPGWGDGFVVPSSNTLVLQATYYRYLRRPEFNKELNPAIGTRFTESQRFAPRADPLVLDLDGDGLETLGLNLASPVYFDHNADGIKTGTGWVKSDDAFLVLDRNGNGTIDDGRELFGDATPLNGKGTLDTSAGIAAEGFAALAKEDTNVPRFGREWHEHRRERSGTDVELPLNFLYGLGHPPKKHEAGTVRCGVIRPVMPTP